MSHSAWYQNDFEDQQALSNVLSKYNDVVAFTSHSHASLYQNNWWGTRRYDGTQEGAIGFPVVNTGAILNEYMPDGDHDEEIVDEQAASGLRVKIYDDRVRVEAWDFKAGHSATNPEGTTKLIKYQDFSKQGRLTASDAVRNQAAGAGSNAGSEPSPNPQQDGSTGSSGSGMPAAVGVIVAVLAALGGLFAFFAPQVVR